jgi:hypothetical protein
MALMSSETTQGQRVNDLEVYRQALRAELELLWDDLADDYRMSRGTPPEESIGCLSRIERIQAITRLVGPCPPGAIPMTFLLTGLYEKVHAQIGITATVPEDTLRSARKYVAEREARLT